MQRNIYLFLLVFFCLLQGCTNAALKPGEYVKWVSNLENGLKVKKVINGYNLELQYEPLAYVALREQFDGQLTKEVLNRKINERSDFQYFVLSISTEDKKMDILKSKIKTTNEYFSRIEYFSYMMQQDIRLIDGNNVLPCQLFQFERDYNVSPYQRFILGFPKDKNNKTKSDKTLVYEDKVLGINKVELKIKSDDIEKLPALKIN